MYFQVCSNSAYPQHSCERYRTSGPLVLLQDTFGRAKTWVKELQRQASPNIVIALAGNKADLANKRMVEYDVSVYRLVNQW